MPDINSEKKRMKLFQRSRSDLHNERSFFKIVSTCHIVKINQ